MSVGIRSALWRGVYDVEFLRFSLVSRGAPDLAHGCRLGLGGCLLRWGLSLFRSRAWLVSARLLL